jgi:hypothetical protein
MPLSQKNVRPRKMITQQNALRDHNKGAKDEQLLLVTKKTEVLIIG